MCRMTPLNGNPNRTGLTDKIANAPPLTCGPPDRRSACGTSGSADERASQFCIPVEASGSPATTSCPRSTTVWPRLSPMRPSPTIPNVIVRLPSSLRRSWQEAALTRGGS